MAQFICTRHYSEVQTLVTHTRDVEIFKRGGKLELVMEIGPEKMEKKKNVPWCCRLERIFYISFLEMKLRSKTNADFMLGIIQFC